MKDGSKSCGPFDDADVVMLLLYFLDKFRCAEMGVEKIWVTFGKGHSNLFFICKVRKTNVQDTSCSAYTNWL